MSSNPRKFVFGNVKNANYKGRKGYLNLIEGLSQPDNSYENLDHVRNYLQNEGITKEVLSYLPAENAPPPPPRSRSIRGGSKSRKSRRSRKSRKSRRSRRRC